MLFESGRIIDIYCKTIEAEPYMFIICIEYAKDTFHLPAFHKSLQNLKYESVVKEFEKQVERKMWLNNDGLPLGAKVIASPIKQLFLSITTMTTSNKHLL
jgi:hypothetical protein